MIATHAPIYLFFWHGNAMKFTWT